MRMYGLLLICRYFVSCLLGWAYVLSWGMSIVCSIRSSLSEFMVELSRNAGGFQSMVFRVLIPGRLRDWVSHAPFSLNFLGS
ncbi:hypothetical protein BDV27DRAFT_136171 [Aspergillus caelatus]|uniref:Uncharacterized protein n=1 Tax=Aspergillus caelatus TaxID=61420 RepID=A0A5N6ZP63_9EURO|nr:uncharacterized protein BDV27DRAFT_136171 [Aspergillus caelatus]KAE8359407.1 hypothetical protein BDV27DRAFT_136171 [Aspergillus caelatus]